MVLNVLQATAPTEPVQNTIFETESIIQLNQIQQNSSRKIILKPDSFTYLLENRVANPLLTQLHQFCASAFTVTGNTYSCLLKTGDIYIFYIECAKDNGFYENFNCAVLKDVAKKVKEMQGVLIVLANKLAGLDGSCCGGLADSIRYTVSTILESDKDFITTVIRTNTIEEPYAEDMNKFFYMLSLLGVQNKTFNSQILGEQNKRDIFSTLVHSGFLKSKAALEAESQAIVREEEAARKVIQEEWDKKEVEIGLIYMLVRDIFATIKKELVAKEAAQRKLISKKANIEEIISAVSEIKAIISPERERETERQQAPTKAQKRKNKK